MQKRNVAMFDSEIVYAVGGIIESFRFLDKYRCEWAGQGVNSVTEDAMRERYNAIEAMVIALNGEYPRVVESFDELKATLKKSAAEVPWDSHEPW